MTLTANLTTTTILDGLNVTLRYAEMLTKDIPEDKFTFMPHPTMNHPAFLLGHLSLYPDKALVLLGKDDMTDAKPGYAELFEHSAKCVNDAGRYPAKDEIVAYYFDRHRVVQEQLPQVDEAALQQPVPGEGQSAKMFRCIGSAVNFYMNGHNMLHLGQLSAWRRAADLPSVM